MKLGFGFDSLLRNGIETGSLLVNNGDSAPDCWMQNRSATLILLTTDPAMGPLVMEAARLAFSRVDEAPVRSLEEVLQRAQSAEHDDLLVLQDPNPEVLKAARSAVDAEGLSRWPIVVLTTGEAPWDDGAVEWVPQELWSPQGLAHAFRSAVSRHALFRENQRARGDLLTVARRVSHDLRSPLNGVVATGEMLKDMVADHEPDAESLAAPLFRSVDGLVKLIERVGVILNATAQPPAFQNVDMATAAGNALQRLERQLLEKKIKVQRPSHWPEVLGVDAWMEVVWWNLIRNSILHGEGLSQIELAWEPCEGGYCFWVRDDGRGVPAAKIKTLFRPFHTLHDQSAPKGFGLPTVRRLVELQGGVCGCEPKDLGAAFFFTLPATVEEKISGNGAEQSPISVVPKPAPPSGETPQAPLPGDAEAHQNAARLGLALDAAKLGGWEWDPPTDLISFSGHGAEICGVPADAKMTRHELRSRLHEEDLKVALSANETALANKTDYDTEYRMRLPSGDWRWIAAKGRGVYDAAGKLTSMLGVIQDITARKQAEEALQSSEKQLQFVTDYAPVNLAHLGRDCRYKFVNRAYALRFGRPTEELVGRHASEVLGAEAFAAAEPHIESVLAGEEVTFEMEMHMADAGERWLSVVYVPERTPSGAVVGFVAMSSDITSRKRAEQEAERARDKALAASRAKDDFLAALSHELRTPLNPVLLLASEAAQNPHLPADVRADFATIRKNVELEARLIDDLLDITRITRGKLFLDVGPVDVHMVLRDALTAVKATLEQKKIVFKLDCRAEPHIIMGDSVRVQQVFWNVLNNAVKFTPPSGTIAVSTVVDPATGMLRIKISDTGVGMTEEELSEIFNAFSQGEHADDGGSHRFGGLGLGLAISRMLVEQHSGVIRAESPGRSQGATFIIEFPFPGVPVMMTDAPADTASAPSPAAVPSLSAEEPLRILLVEDHEATRVALMQLLVRRRFSVTSAASLGEAREVAARERFHLLISDIGLPDGNGCDLMSELRGSQGLSGIALTGYGMENDIARTRAAGFATHLIKPLSVQSLEKAIAHVLAADGVGK